ncbi:hypothetical protein J2R80_001960 [Bradyrhizobium sp. USDA 4541]|uniref:hypothetical protein n=1 Tax=Bradyrhizobium sp. USDA 4541 TaxID=2817704 RepID=UPI0020A4D910|nr:hypothetical protein [Bradyrhizobium sp. USDA 4541]MCP1848137.1 hypothetical protein [Bradyrhizobium sp. USDA 4541]
MVSQHKRIAEQEFGMEYAQIEVAVTTDATVLTSGVIFVELKTYRVGSWWGTVKC